MLRDATDGLLQLAHNRACIRVAIVETLMRGYQGSRGAGVVFQLLKTKTLGFSDGDFNKVREWIRHLEYVARGRLWAPVAGAGAGGLANWCKTTGWDRRVYYFNHKGETSFEKPVHPDAATSGAANVYPAAPYFLCELARGKPSRESALADVFGGCSAILRDAVRAFLDTFHGDGPDVYEMMAEGWPKSTRRRLLQKVIDLDSGDGDAVDDQGRSWGSHPTRALRPSWPEIDISGIRHDLLGDQVFVAKFGNPEHGTSTTGSLTGKSGWTAPSTS